MSPDHSRGDRNESAVATTREQHYGGQGHCGKDREVREPQDSVAWQAAEKNGPRGASCRVVLGLFAIEVGCLGDVETILDVTSPSSQCVTSNEQCNEQRKPACGRGATEPHGLAVRHSSRMVSSITVCHGRLIARMSTATAELRYSSVDVQQKQEIYRNPTSTLEIDLMMSVQPNLWCLDLNLAPRAAASAAGSANAFRGKVNMKVIAHFRILHLASGLAFLHFLHFLLHF